jgi:hypothetical protein
MYPVNFYRVLTSALLVCALVTAMQPFPRPFVPRLPHTRMLVREMTTPEIAPYLAPYFRNLHEDAKPQAVTATLSAQPRRLAQHGSGCGGQSCSTSSARVSCPMIGSAPGLCNYSSYVNWDGTRSSYSGFTSSYYNGTCIAVNPDFYIGNVIGKPCSSTFSCNTFSALYVSLAADGVKSVS